MANNKNIVELRSLFNNNECKEDIVDKVFKSLIKVKIKL